MRKATLSLLVLFSLLTLSAPPAQAQTLNVLHSFSGGTDGIQPFGGLVRDKAGNLYGTTADGGASFSIPNINFGYGTVFKVHRTGTPTSEGEQSRPGAQEIVLHSFSGLDGSMPLAGLVRDSKGNLYGTTNIGGAFGFGTVFKLAPLSRLQATINQ